MYVSKRTREKSIFRHHQPQCCVCVCVCPWKGRQRKESEEDDEEHKKKSSLERSLCDKRGTGLVFAFDNFYLCE